MHHSLRVLRTLSSLPGKRRLAPLEEVRTRTRVWVDDIDSNLHMTNSRYMQIMDLGRVAWMVRTGLMREAIRVHRARPMMGSVALRFKYELEPFRRFEVVTQLRGWDEKWFYVEQRFEVEQRARAVAMVKLIFRGPEANIAPADMVAGLDAELAEHMPWAEPELGAWIKEQRF